MLTPVREALEEKLADLTLDDVLTDIRARAGVSQIPFEPMALASRSV